MGCLLGSGADEKFAGDLDAVWPFEPAQLSLDFRPSLFTLVSANFSSERHTTEMHLHTHLIAQ